MTEAAARRSRRSRGGGGGAARRASAFHCELRNGPIHRAQIPNFEVLNEEALEIIEHNAETVLEEIGVNFVENPAALERWRAAGAEVESDRVRLPRGLARELIRKAPGQYTQTARNPERNVVVGGRNMVCAPIYGPPFVRDMDAGRRYATMADFEKFVKLGYMSKWLHHSGGTVCEPTDIPVNKRHLDMLKAHMTLSDKPFMGSVTDPDRARDSVEMCEILFGKQFVRDNTVMTSLININSPMTFDEVMMGALEIYAKNNQACILSPFIVGGAMAPTTVAGTLTQVLAEVMAGIAYAQLVRPGRAGGFRRLRHLDRHEQRRAHLRHAGGGAHHLRRRAAGAAAGPAVPLGGLVQRLQAARRAGRLRERQQSQSRPAVGRELHAALLRLAGRRSGRELREVRHGCRPAGRAASLRPGRRDGRERPGDGRDPRSRPRAGTIWVAPIPRRTSSRRSGARTCSITSRSNNGPRKASATR